MHLKQEILNIIAMPKIESLAGDRQLRDGKTYERASNARVNFPSLNKICAKFYAALSQK